MAKKQNPPQNNKRTGNEKKDFFHSVYWYAIVGTVIGLALFLLFVWVFAPQKLDEWFSPNPLKTNSTVMRIDDNAISSDEYLFYAYYYKSGVERFLDPSVWETNPEYFDTIKTSVYEEILTKYTMLKWAEELGITVSDLNEEDAQKYQDQLLGDLGDDISLEEALKNNCLNKKTFDMLIRQSAALDKLQNLVFSDPYYSNVSDEEILDYFNDNDMYALKHIMFSATDIDTAQDKYYLAVQVYNKLLDGADFDEMMVEYSEDPDLAEYPNGYAFFKNDDSNKYEFEQIALSLDEGEMSSIEPTSYGYEIILRLEPTIGNLRPLLYDDMIDLRIQDKLKEVQSNMTIKFSRGYDNISSSDIVNKYS